MNGNSESSMLTVTGSAALSSVSLGSVSVVGGRPVVETVTLSSAAGDGGALVALSSADPVTVPPTPAVQ